MEDHAKKTTESTLTVTQPTVMNMECTHEMVNWSKWFDQNPQTSHQINFRNHDCTTATTKSTNHCSHKMNITQTQIYKLQVSGFTNKLFHVSRFQNQQNSLQLLKNSCKLLSAQTQQSLSSLASSQTILSDLTGFKNTSTGAILQDIAPRAILQDIALNFIQTVRPSH